MKKITAEEYGKWVKKASPNTKSYRTIPMAFLVGGLICTLGQGIMELWRMLGVEEELVPGAASVTLVLFSVLATGFGVYDKLAKHAGAGTLVPITGFANAVASPALEFKSEGLITGTAAKLFVVAGPVLVFGISASVLYGLILCIFRG